MEGYIYLGEYYDVLGRELYTTDKKIGKTISLTQREYQLNRTKSPIGYKITFYDHLDTGPDRPIAH